MKLLYAKIKGLIGLYRGSGLREIEIDFTKCKSGVILIIGGNGSGKSTLENALDPLPDPQSDYIQGEEGYKELHYQKDNILYKILIQYPVDKSGKRTTTKAYITKHTIGDIPLELNPNGNVSSYKECIYTEFKLDANFAALTSLSLEDKGLVTKTPAERKKYVGAIVSKVEVFNNIHKVLNKRSSIFKSMINNLIAKIDSIGNESDIEGRLSNIDNRIKVLSERRENAVKKVAKAEAMVQQLDFDGHIQEQYTNLHSQIQSIQGQIQTIEMFIKQYMFDPYEIHIKDSETAKKDTADLQLEMDRLSISIESKKEELQRMLKEKEEDANTISIKTAKVSSLRSQYDFETLANMIKEKRSKIEEYKGIIKMMQLDPETVTLTKDEFIAGLNTLKEIKDQINVFRSFSYDNIVSDVIDSMAEGTDLTAVYMDKEECIKTFEDAISSHEQDIARYTALSETADILLKRPSTCKIDDCAFIEKALKARYQDPDNKLSKSKEYLEYCRGELSKLQKSLKEVSDMIQVKHSIDIILRMINNHRAILDKLPNGYIFTEEFLERLKSGSPFNEINDIYQYLSYANVFEVYKQDKEDLMKMESDYEIYKNRAAIIEEISDEIKALEKSLDGLVEKIESLNRELFQMESDRQSISSVYQIVSAVSAKYDDLERLKREKDTVEHDIRVISLSMEQIESAVRDMNESNSEILNIDNELNPIKAERESLGFSLSKLKDYTEELRDYSAKYDKVEIIKKYSSPTKAGIQNLFIDVYMGQTLRIANELLSMFFNGKLRLKNYIIDDTQFAIPCTSLESSIDNDDISSCSGGEKSMIGLILSFALLQQSSTEYNILRLDEIDGTLDQSNRSQFVEVLSYIMNALNMENCIMISHASESALDNADLICLNMDGLEIPRGNVIFKV